MEPNQIKESNRAITKDLSDRSISRINESLKSTFGLDAGDKKVFDFSSPRFSWTEARRGAYKLAERLKESNAEGIFGSLLRAGINTMANGWYNLVETNHEQVGATTTSTHAIEPYAPLHRGATPRRVVRGQPFPETRVAGLDIQIMNEKFGAIVSFERELFDDDQTGQISQRARDIGENMRILEDAWFFQRFTGTAGSYGGDTIPASQTYTTVWSTSLSGGGKNKPASYAAFTSAGVQALDILLMNQVDLLGNKMLVNPNTLLVGANLKFPARTMLNSEWYPSTTAMAAGGTGTTTGIGASYARNVLQGLYNLVVSRFYGPTAYALGEAGKGIVFQRRDALEVVQENTQSGMAFTQDEYRFRSRSRWEPDWIDPRFWAQGSDGSV
jgi:hypothetical protein